MNNTLKLAALVASEFLAMAVAVWGQTTPVIPTFYARRDYFVANQFIQVADANDDGIPDLLAEEHGDVVVQFGNGDGTFRTGPNTNTSAGNAISFVATDLNGDQTIDLAMGNGSGVVIALGNGDGTFQSSVSYPISDTNISFLAVGDLNGDGILDIAAAGKAGVWLLTGKGGGTFSSAVLAVSLSKCLNIAAADFNQDGNLDLVVTRQGPGGYGAGFAVLLGNGNGTFQSPQIFSKPNQPTALAVGSLTRGGPPSIAVNDNAIGYAYLYFGNGTGGFAGPKVVPLPGGTANSLTLGDVNGDGFPDLVSTSGNVAYGVRGGDFTAPVSFPVSSVGPGSNVVVADLRNNGLTDIVTSGGDAISVVLNQMNKGFEDGIWTSVAGGAGCGARGDFNRDGKPDLAVNNGNGISVLIGTGKGATPFSTGTDIALPGAGCLVTGDINGDGKLDLLVPVNGTVVTYLGNGDGTFTLTSTTPTPSGGYLALGDFDHDGKLDFATSGNLLALGNGDGTFQNPTDIVASPPQDGYSGITVGDVNNDNWPDLVLTSAGVFQFVTVLVNNHRGGFTQVPTAFGDRANQPTLADFNGDGNLDLVVLSFGIIVMALGNGQGGFTFIQYIDLPVGVGSLMMVADVNGDGIADIGLSGAGTLTFYLGNGDETFPTWFSIGTGSSPGSVLVENLRGQSAKAELPDIVVPDTSGGVMVLLNLTP
jgi:hypothetical protein